MRIQKYRFYRAYAISPVRIRISGFCETKIPDLIVKAALFVDVYVCLCFYLQLRVFCLKYPFYTTSVFAYKSANQSVHSVGPLPLKYLQMVNGVFFLS